MKIENMKLGDLQTGKYLELGKDWHYCGNRIYLVGRLKECITSFNEFLRSQIKILDKYKEIDGQRNIGYELAFKIATSDDECLNNAVDAQVDSGYVEKSEPQGKLKTLCDKIGAVVYGDRYVLIKTFEYLNKEIKVGDIITAKTLTTSKDSISIKQHTNQIVCFRDNTAFEHSGYNMGFVICENLKCFGINGFWKHRPFDYEERQLEITGNLFEEYSKQLRKEENKFDELMEKLK